MEPVEKFFFGVMGVGLSLGVYVLLYVGSGSQEFAIAVTAPLVTGSIIWGLKDLFN